jgi:exosome complex RNA-binding protein Rrp42 (RNase PH superfamily)
LRLALQRGHDEVARLLVERGADSTSVEEQAVSNEDEQVVIDVDEQVATPWQVTPNQGAVSVLIYVLAYILVRMLERIDAT